MLQIKRDYSFSLEERLIIGKIYFVACTCLIYAMATVECLYISTDDIHWLLKTGKRFLYVNIYIHRVDESYIGLQTACILEIEIGITKQNLSWFHMFYLCE